jgi:hypothetical protein
MLLMVVLDYGSPRKDAIEFVQLGRFGGAPKANATTIE